MNRKLKASLVPICVFTLSFGIGLGLQALAREKPEAQPTLNNTSNNTLTTPAVDAISLNHDIDPVEIEKLSLESVIKKIRAGDFQISIDNLRGDDGYIIPEEALFAVYLFIQPERKRTRDCPVSNTILRLLKARSDGLETSRRRRKLHRKFSSEQSIQDMGK